MTALALIGNYALVLVPNVELGSTVLFVTAYIFGLLMGAWCTLLMSFIFAMFNPWGGFIPQIWVTQLIGWLFIVTVASLLGRIARNKNEDYDARSLLVIGFLLTVFFDLITNLGYALAFSIPYFLTLITGAPFMAVHAGSNAILFSQVVPRITNVINADSYIINWRIENEDITGQNDA